MDVEVKGCWMCFCGGTWKQILVFITIYEKYYSSILKADAR
jgi:hypothetical protein